jgi:hypothetical protein
MGHGETKCEGRHLHAVVCDADERQQAAALLGNALVLTLHVPWGNNI